MDLDEAIRRRRMCRDFTAEPLDPQVVDRLVDRARRAPSAGHTQGWSFLALGSPEAVGRFWNASAEPSWLAAPSLPGLLRAPLIVVPWYSRAAYEARYSEADKEGIGGWNVPYWLVDASFATMLLMLGVTGEGLGTLFFRLRDGAPERLRQAFGVPAEWSPLGALAIGHPAGSGGPAGSAARGRKPIGSVLHRDRWGAG